MTQPWRERVRALKRDVYALYLAYRDPRTPWAARIVAACVVAYALSPIDLIPDFVPVLGTLDDLILVPLGLLLAIRLIPPEVMADCRARADTLAESGKPVSRAGMAAIIVMWVLGAAALGVLAVRWLSR